MTKDEQWLLEEKYKGTGTGEFENDKNRLATGEPVAYLIGHQPFLGLKIYLDSRPLIPRPETEWWTEQMLNTFVSRESVEPFSVVGLGRTARSATENGSTGERGIRMLDLCAGSGAIGCAVLAKLPKAQVYFGEIDPTHGATILKNIRENNLDATRAYICIGDLFEPFTNMQFDLIAANPPYVPILRTLPTSVTDYEPFHALYAGVDGLDIIRRIGIMLAHHLTPSGEAWIECDSTHAAAACVLFRNQGFNSEIRTDQYNKPRSIVVSFP